MTEVELARSSSGGAGSPFGPLDQRRVYLQWMRGDGCVGTGSLVFPANLAPTKTVTSKLTVSLNPDYVYGGERNCLPALIGWKSVTYSYLNSLPTDPAALEKIILQYNRPGGLIPTDADAIFDAINTLLAEGEREGVVVSAKLEATFYRIFQQLPGVHFASAADLAGRTGLGFWMVAEGYAQQEIVIDPATYHYIGTKTVALKDHAENALDGTRHIKAGQVLDWEALLGSAIVQHPGQLP